MSVRIVRLGAPRLLRPVAAGVGAERAARVMGAVGTVHAQTLGRLRAALPARDAPADGRAPDRIASRAIFADGVFRRLLL